MRDFLNFKIKWIVLGIIFNFCHITQAQVAELFLWKAPGSQASIVLPRLQNESKVQAWNRYIQALHKTSDLKQLIHEKHNFKRGHLKSIESSLDRSQFNVGVIANKYSDHIVGDQRMTNFVQLMKMSEANPIIIAMASDLGLTRNEARQLRQRLVDYFPMLVALGGDDISPKLYDENSKAVGDVSYRRDRFEFELIQDYKKSESGFFFGICRGHQMNAIIEGHQLYSDMSELGYRYHEHGDLSKEKLYEKQQWHNIHVLERSLLSRLISAVGSMRVNSVHHQAVKLNKKIKNAYSNVVAGAKGVVEALEQKNGFGLSVQFHPEFSFDMSRDLQFVQLGEKFFKRLVSYAQIKSEQSIIRRHNKSSLEVKSCRTLF